MMAVDGWVGGIFLILFQIDLIGVSTGGGARGRASDELIVLLDISASKK